MDQRWNGTLSRILKRLDEKLRSDYHRPALILISASSWSRAPSASVVDLKEFAGSCEKNDYCEESEVWRGKGKTKKMRHSFVLVR